MDRNSFIYIRCFSKPLRFQLAMSASTLCAGWIFAVVANRFDADSISFLEVSFLQIGILFSLLSPIVALFFPLSFFHRRFLRLLSCSSAHRSLVQKPMRKLFFLSLVVFVFTLISASTMRVWIYTNEPALDLSSPFRSFCIGFIMALMVICMYSAMCGLGCFMIGFTRPVQDTAPQSE